MPHKRLVGTVLLLSFVAAAVLPGVASQPPATPSPGLNLEGPESVVFYRQQKLRTEAAAQLIAAHCAGTPAKCLEAQKLYNAAYASYNAYVDQVLDMVIKKQKGDLQNSANAASAAVQKFNDYVDTTVSTRSVGAAVTAVTTLIEAGVKIFDFFSKRSEAKRKAAVDSLKPDVRLREWAVVVKAIGAN